MISNQILQNTIDGLKSITRRDYCVLDAESKIVVTTDGNATGKYFPVAFPSVVTTIFDSASNTQ